MSDDTYYSFLGVSETATQSEIKAAYRELLKKIHPDTVSTLSPELRREAEDATIDIIKAYSVLSDANKRGQYDRALGLNQNKPPAVHRWVATDVEAWEHRSKVVRPPTSADVLQSQSHRTTAKRLAAAGILICALILSVGHFARSGKNDTSNTARSLNFPSSAPIPGAIIYMRSGTTERETVDFCFSLERSVEWQTLIQGWEVLTPDEANGRWAADIVFKDGHEPGERMTFLERIRRDSQVEHVKVRAARKKDL